MTYRPDIRARGLREVLSLFERAPRLRAIVGALLDEVQAVEDALLDVRFALTLRGAYGANLDVLGRVLGEPRDGLEDGEYRAILSAKLLVSRAQGERWRVVDIVRAATGARDVTLQPVYPASYIVTYATGAPLRAAYRERVRKLVEASTASGVGFSVVEAGEDYFGFLEDPQALAFNTGDFADVF